MTLVKYKPRTQLASSFDNWVDNFFNLDAQSESDYNLNPKIEISENEKSYILSADLPGINKKDVDLSVSNDTMTISGERKSSDKRNAMPSIYNSIKYGTFSKSFYIPEDANTDKIDAKMQNGVLFITIQKLESIPEDIKKISIK